MYRLRGISSKNWSRQSGCKCCRKTILQNIMSDLVSHSQGLTFGDITKLRSFTLSITLSQGLQVCAGIGRLASGRIV